MSDDPEATERDRRFHEELQGIAGLAKGTRVHLSVYGTTGGFPREELFGLTSQMRRSAVSIAANIAEGCGRRSDGEMVRFLRIARGSAAEIEYHVLLAHDLRFIREKEYRDLAHRTDELQRMLTALMRRFQPAKA